MSIVWLIRHAESQANAGGRTSYPSEIALTQHGHEQARCVADAFTHAPDLIITSPYLRTQQTAAPLLERFPASQSLEMPVHEFTYLAPERCQNTTWQERVPMAAEYWKRCDPHYVDGLGAESFAGLIDRVNAFMAYLKENQGLFIAAFTHGQFVQALLWRLISNPITMTSASMRGCMDFMYSFDIPNAAIVKLRLDGGIWMSGVETHHLPGEVLAE